MFGFSRKGIEKFLDTPQSFSIGFVKSTDYALVESAARSGSDAGDFMGPSMRGLWANSP